MPAPTPTPAKTRSWLFAPGDSARKMEKAAGGPADIVILDLIIFYTNPESFSNTFNYKVILWIFME